MKESYEILVVEDDIDSRELLKEAIQMEGHSVKTASNGRDALKILKKENPPRLILLDLFMPIMSGYELLDRIMARPDVRSIPIVVVSAFGEGLEGSGISAFLKKPIDLQKLHNIIEKFCARTQH